MKNLKLIHTEIRDHVLDCVSKLMTTCDDREIQMTGVSFTGSIVDPDNPENEISITAMIGNIGGHDPEKEKTP